MQRIHSEPSVFRMRPGAGPPPLDAVRSSLCLRLIVFLLCAEAAVSAGGVYNGESDCFSEPWLKLDMSCNSYIENALHGDVFSV